jgi:hypothetical protein
VSFNHPCFQLQRRKCGNNCVTCRELGGHGPFLYAFWRDSTGRLRSMYVGAPKDGVPHAVQFAKHLARKAVEPPKPGKSPDPKFTPELLAAAEAGAKSARKAARLAKSASDPIPEAIQAPRPAEAPVAIAPQAPKAPAKPAKAPQPVQVNMTAPNPRITKPKTAAALPCSKAHPGTLADLVALLPAGTTFRGLNGKSFEGAALAPARADESVWYLEKTSPTAGKVYQAPLPGAAPNPFALAPYSFIVPEES